MGFAVILRSELSAEFCSPPNLCRRVFSSHVQPRTNMTLFRLAELKYAASALIASRALSLRPVELVAGGCLFLGFLLSFPAEIF